MPRRARSRHLLLNSLLFTNKLLPQVRRVLPGFELIEQRLAASLKAHFDTPIELFEAHCLRQEPDSSSATSFPRTTESRTHPFPLFDSR